MIKLEKSKAENAYDLLSDVCAAILAEPLRINMDLWITQFKEPRFNQAVSDKPAPQCGTIGCIGGWTEILAYGDDYVFEGIAKRYCSNAQQILGVHDKAPTGFNRDLDKLFFDWDTTKLHDGTYGTKKYARAVVKNIRDFQKKYASYLRTVKLRDTVREL